MFILEIFLDLWDEGFLGKIMSIFLFIACLFILFCLLFIIDCCWNTSVDKEVTVIEKNISKEIPTYVNINNVIIPVGGGNTYEIIVQDSKGKIYTAKGSIEDFVKIKKDDKITIHIYTGKILKMRVGIEY